MPLQFLIIDDLMVSRALRAVLKITYRGCTVRIAATYKRAMQALARFRPNLIIAGDGCPGSSVEHFLDELHAKPSMRFIPVIVTPAYAPTPKRRLYLYDYGFNVVLPKPLMPEKLLHKINHLLQVPANPDAALVHYGSETQSLDYKEALDLDSKDGRAALAKDVIAMANWGGGHLVIGVAEPRPGKFVPRGLTAQSLTALETSRVNRAIRDFLDPPISVAPRQFTDSIGTFVILNIPPAVGTLILPKKQNDRAGLYPGRVYTRTSSAESAEIQNSSELRQMLDRIYGQSSSDSTA